VKVVTAAWEAVGEEEKRPSGLRVTGGQRLGESAAARLLQDARRCQGGRGRRLVKIVQSMRRM
jgi:hypothetical protein